MCLFVLSFVVVGLFAYWVEGINYYCADVRVVEAKTLKKHATGKFSMIINSGHATYSFRVNLSGVTNCDFNQYPTVAYHIHSFSVSGPKNKATPSCANAGEHYDPNLACSEKSEAHLTLCGDLNRTAKDGYNYHCVSIPPVFYYNIPTGRCEVGDLSGKFGRVAVSADGVVQSADCLVDLLPPYAYNFRNPTANITEGWASIVFHCGDPPATRIACGDFCMTYGIKAHAQTASTTEPHSGCYDFP